MHFLLFLTYFSYRQLFKISTTFFIKHVFNDALIPGGRYDGGPIGVGLGASTSLSVEPSDKLLTVGRDGRPSSNSLIWNKSSRFQTHLHCVQILIKTCLHS